MCTGVLTTRAILTELTVFDYIYNHQMLKYQSACLIFDISVLSDHQCDHQCQSHWVTEYILHTSIGFFEVIMSLLVSQSF